MVSFALLEFDFTIVVRKGEEHVLVDHMCRIPSGEPPSGVEDDLLDAPLFNLDLVPKWSEKISYYLVEGLPNDWLVNKNKSWHLIKLVALYQN